MNGSKLWIYGILFATTLLSPLQALGGEESQNVPENPTLETLTETDREIITMLDLLQTLDLLKDMDVVALLEDKS